MKDAAPWRSIRLFKQWHPLSRHFCDLPLTLGLKTFVANPDVTLRRFFKFGPLPSEAQAADCRSSIANLIREATAAEWRYLAVTSAGRDFNPRELMRAMISYLKTRELIIGRVIIGREWTK